MRFRIIMGQASETAGSEAGLRILHRGPSLRVEGDQHARWLVLRDGGYALLAGDVSALRTRSGGLEAAPGDLASLGGVLAAGVSHCRETLQGRWALVLVGADGSVELGSDAFGRGEIYYRESPGGGTFASGLDLVPIAHGGPYDQAALAHVFCVYGHRPPKRHTLYTGLRRLGVGETARWTGGTLSVRDDDFTPVASADFGDRELNEYADIFLETLRQTGSRHGNIVYLSSGWDSTSILAGLVTVFGARRVRAVTGRMLYSERAGVINQFEIDRARAMAAYYGIQLDIVDFDWRKQVPAFFERLQPMLRAQQLMGGTALTHGALAEYVAANSRGDEAVFAGEISDGAHNLGFSQYATIFHPVLDFREYADKMGSYLVGPSFLRRFLDGGAVSDDPIYDLFRRRCGDAIFDAPAAAGAPRRQQFLSNFFLRANRLPLWSLRNNRALTERGRTAFADEMERTYLAKPAETLTPETLYAWYLRLYNSFHWQGSTVSTITLTAQEYGLRLQLPFWDARLQEFLAAMPESFGRGLDLNPTKYPLKWMLKHRIDYPMHLQTGPHSYLYDVDHSFSHAAESLQRSALTPYFKERLRRRGYQSLLSADVFDLGYLDGIVDRYLAGEELKGEDLGDLGTLCWLTATGWYGGN
jgi:hypothetical protein